MGFLVKKAADEIVEAKVIITQAELLAGNIIKIVPEYPATANKAWCVMYFIAEFTGTAYTGISTIHIEANGSNAVQYRFGGGFLSGSLFKFAPIVTPGTASTQFLVNKGLEIHGPTEFVGGTGNVTLYIGAKLFTI